MRSPGEMEVLRVDEVRREASGIISILVKPEDPERWRGMIPGQFLMVWIPGVDEVPMSVSYLFGDPLTLGITVQNIGDATRAICDLREGDRIGIRGPYGNGFSLPDRTEKNTIIGVSGGVGSASTILPMEWAHMKGFDTINLIGSRSQTNLLFRDRWCHSSDRTGFATDDGSYGHHGFVTELLRKELKGMTDDERDKTLIFTCGPEMMMMAVKTVLDQYGVQGQFSLERFMKCGMGVCDSCSVSGHRVCMDGPVFTGDRLNDLKEFGKSHRDRSGRLIPLKECVR